MLRMPRHTRLSKYQKTPSSLYALHSITHAQTYTNQQIPGNSAVPLCSPSGRACPDIHNPTDVKGSDISPHLPPGHACQRIHHLTECFRQYLWLGNARQTDKPLPPRPHYPRPHIRSGAARSTGTAPDRLKRPWIWEWLSVVTQSHVDAADKRADHVIQQRENRRQQSEQHHADDGEDGHRAQHRAQREHVGEVESAGIKACR